MLASDGLSGYFVASGVSALSQEVAFKERLITLLKGSRQSLAHLETRDVLAQQSAPEGRFWTAFSKRHVLAGTGTSSFVPERVRIDFAVNFNHTRGVSQKALQESLRHIADAGTGALVGKELQNRNQTRRMKVPEVCDAVDQKAKCEKSCEQYVSHICESCDCDKEHEGTPQCICILMSSMLYNALFSNSIYAVMMLVFGLCARNAVLKTEPLTTASKTGPWPNIAGQEFESGIFDCCNNMNSACMVCCCPAVRAAMTYYWAGWSASYLKLLFLMCLLWGAPAYMMEVIVPIVLFLGRRRIRRNAPMYGDLCTDLCCVCCCGACTLCQEARHVDACLDQVAKQKLAESGDLVGQAVALDDP